MWKQRKPVGLSCLLQGTVAPSGESQLAETALANQLKSGEKEKVDFTQEDQSMPSMLKTALLTASHNWLRAPVGGGLTEGQPTSPEELESMSSSDLGFGLLVKGMAKRVGSAEPGESEEGFMKRAVVATAPIVNSLVQWKAGAQKRVQRFLNQEEPPAAGAPLRTLDEFFIQGTTVEATKSSMGVFNAAGVELVFDDDKDAYTPALDTAFDDKVWGLVCDAETSTASVLRDTITGTHQSSADYGGGDDDTAGAQ